MKQADKDLLIKDICARLPYGVVIQEKCIEHDEEFLPYAEDNKLVSVCVDEDLVITNNGSRYYIGEFKPYLFPLSSMTEAQRKELEELHFGYISDEIFNDIEFIYHYDCMHLIDWCYKNNLDINGLIPRGLAIDATGLNIYINYENNNQKTI